MLNGVCGKERHCNMVTNNDLVIAACLPLVFSIKLLIAEGIWGIKDKRSSYWNKDAKIQNESKINGGMTIVLLVLLLVPLYGINKIPLIIMVGFIDFAFSFGFRILRMAIHETFGRFSKKDIEYHPYAFMGSIITIQIILYSVFYYHLSIYILTALGVKNG